MPFARARRRLAAVFALLAVLVPALAPALSHALAPSTPPGWVEVCTSQGPQAVQADVSADRTSPPVPVTGHAAEHCAYCASPAHPIALAPAAPQIHPGWDLALERAPPAAPVPGGGPVWSRSHARAPPTSP